MKIAFTCCCRIESTTKQPVWDAIYKADPDLLFLLGDTIYMDYGWRLFSSEPSEAPKYYSLDKFKSKMLEKYEKQFSHPGFKRLIEHMRAKDGLHAIWDDHDFAWDGARGGEMTNENNEKKEFSRDCFHKFLATSKNKPHVYYHIDTPLARIIFLDNRYYTTMHDGQGVDNVLGQEQFNYLEERFNNHTLPYTLVCSGITLNDGKDNWSNFPHSEQRLYRLLNSRQKGVIFISGDIHENKFHKPYNKNGKEAKFYELISSGAALTKLGLGIWMDNIRNWGLLELQEDGFDATLYRNIDHTEIKKSVKLNNWSNPE